MTQLMLFRRRTLVRLGAGLVTLSFLGGCGLSSLTSGLGSSVLGNSSSSSSKVDSVTEEQMLSAAKADLSSSGLTTTGAIAHGCPKFVPWPGDKNLTIFEAGREGDSLAVLHRGEITKTARECRVAPGSVTVKYGFSGRVLLGPKGTPGPIAFPISVFVTDAKRERIATDRLTVNVEMSTDKPIGYFSAVKEVTFNVAEGTRPGEYEVFVAFERKVPGAG